MRPRSGAPFPAACSSSTHSSASSCSGPRASGSGRSSAPSPHSPVGATARTAPAERTFVDRLLAAVPLLSVFLWLSIVYAVEAWAHSTPWLFTDELELAQLSRAIAATGHAARRGEAHSFDTLWTYVTAPAWRIDNTHTAYATVKYLGVITMTLT